MSFFELKDCDVISTKFTAHPSYDFTASVTATTIGEGLLTYIISSSVGQSRDFQQVDGELITGSAYNLSGTVKYINSDLLYGKEKVALNRIRDIYFRNAFKKQTNYSSSSVFDPNLSAVDQSVGVINVPYLLYGTELKAGSVTARIVSGSGDTVYEFSDDGLGGLYSGSLLRGCVFYQHGIVWLGPDAPQFPSQVTASFSGTHKIPINVYLCRVPRGELNFSNNSSYVSYVSSSLEDEITTAQPKVFITGIGLYDENYDLLGVAKLATPILNTEDSGIEFRIKVVF